ncbi:Protein of unknown function DUF1616 [Halomicrobium mukohataei DSM 12286]|uniref:DUF1616 domain-containing protein n=2 Tax=Halomicrobium mukohataei TaxID=57705 RepID=C7NW03_HALMD|nr:Protein of unknown function DUF1616 [Halomicrobium mukohataei DSM 12286]
MRGDSESSPMSDRTVQSSSVALPRLASSIDVAAVVLLALVGAILFSLPLGLPVAARAVLAVPLLLFVPGYAVVAALYPAARRETETTVDGPTAIERAALAVGLSLFVVPLVGVAVEAVWSLTLVPVLDTVAAVTIAAGVIALVRRERLPVGERFEVTTPLRRALAGTTERPKTQVFLIVAVLLSVAAVGAGGVVATADSGQEVTEFYLTTDGPDGERVMATAETIGNESVHELVVESPERPGANYTVVARTGIATDRGVVEERTLGRTSLTLGDGGTGTATYALDLERGDRPLELTYLLYEGEPPGEPSRESAVRWLRVRIR